MARDIYQKLALLTDAEAELCLHGLLKGLTILEEDYEILLQSPKEMAAVVEDALKDEGNLPQQISEPTPEQRPKAVRLILSEIAEDDALRPQLENWVDNARPTMLDPVTTALVLGGIVFVLSTHIKFEYANEGGKKKLKVKVEKKPTKTSVLSKFFKIFN